VFTNSKIKLSIKLIGVAPTNQEVSLYMIPMIPEI
jgi:hypothetical protein